MATDRHAVEEVWLLVFSAAAAASPSREQGPIPNSADFVIALLPSLILTRAQAAGRQAGCHLGQRAEGCVHRTACTTKRSGADVAREARAIQVGGIAASTARATD